MKKGFLVLVLAAFAALAFGQDIVLSKAPDKLGVDVLSAIRARAAARAFVKGEVPIADLSAIVWAADGLKGTPDAVSSASKAGGAFPVSGEVNYVNLYLLNAKGVYRYLPEGNVLKQVDSKDERAAVTPESIANSAFMLLFTYDAAKLPSFVKGNATMGTEMGMATASYGGENAALVAAGLKLSSIVMFNVVPAATAAAAKLSKSEAPLFIMQVGYTK